MKVLSFIIIKNHLLWSFLLFKALWDENTMTLPCLSIKKTSVSSKTGAVMGSEILCSDARRHQLIFTNSGIMLLQY